MPLLSNQAGTHRKTGYDRTNWAAECAMGRSSRAPMRSRNMKVTTQLAYGEGSSKEREGGSYAHDHFSRGGGVTLMAAFFGGGHGINWGASPLQLEA